MFPGTDALNHAYQAVTTDALNHAYLADALNYEYLAVTTDALNHEYLILLTQSSSLADANRYNTWMCHIYNGLFHY